VRGIFVAIGSVYTNYPFSNYYNLEMYLALLTY